MGGYLGRGEREGWAFNFFSCAKGLLLGMGVWMDIKGR
jgi:hypothetical protein